MIRIAIACVLCLGACAPRGKPEPIVRTVTVNVPVPVPCRPDIGPEPEYADSPEALAAATDIFEAVRARIAGREQRQARETVLKAALEGCR